MINFQKTINETLSYKQDKTLSKVIEKFQYNWSENQLKTMQIIKKNTAKIVIDNNIIRFSIFDKKNLITDKNFIYDFFYFYYSFNIINLMKTCGYEYLNFNNDNVIDVYSKDASFKGFNFTRQSLTESLLKDNNYMPFYAYVNRKPNFYLICGGRHRMQVLKNHNISKKFLCIFWDCMPQEIKCELWIPNDILNENLYLLNLKILEKKEKFSKILIEDATDLWLSFKALDKELTYLIDIHLNLLKELNIFPPNGLLWKDFSEKQ